MNLVLYYIKLKFIYFTLYLYYLGKKFLLINISNLNHYLLIKLKIKEDAFK